MRPQCVTTAVQPKNDSATACSQQLTGEHEDQSRELIRSNGGTPQRSGAHFAGPDSKPKRL